MLYIIIGAAVLVVGLIVFLIIRVKIRKKTENLIQVDADKKRLEELDKKVLNPSNTGQESNNYGNTPYESKYQTAPEGKKKKQYLMQVEEVTGVSTQKYVFNSTDIVTVGVSPDNTIVIRGQANLGELKARFLFFEDEPGIAYIENQGKSDQITLHHKKDNLRLCIGQRMKVSGGDELLIGEVKLKIKFVKVN